MSVVVNLKASNILRLTAIDITPVGVGTVVIGGKNGAGKSSVLNAIAMAIGGKTLVPEEPIHGPETKASIEVNLGDIIVKRTFTRDRLADDPTSDDFQRFGPTNSYLTVTTKDGAKYPSPQAMLDKLFGDLTFDPMVFVKMGADDPRKQADILAKIVGMDTSALDETLRTLMVDRKVANSEVKTLEARLSGISHYEGVGIEPITAEDVAAELDEAERLRAFAAKAEGVLREAEQVVERGVTLRASLESTILDIEKKIEILQAEHGERLKQKIELLDAISKQRLNVSNAQVAYQTAVDAVPDVMKVKARLAEIEAHNSKAAWNARWQETNTFRKMKTEVAETLQQQIDDTRQKRADAIAQLTFPVPGLSIENGRVMFEGFPFAQASTAIQLRTSVAIGLALNPSLKVLLVRDGSLLDDDNLALIGQLAAENDAQIWIERVAKTGDPVTVMISEGGQV